MGNSQAEQYSLVAMLFIKLLGIIYLAAFASIAVQITGLAGSQGILPFTAQLEQIAAEYGVMRYFRLPSIFWVSANDAFLVGAAVAGAVAAVLIMVNCFLRSSLIVAFALYLSLYHAGQIFMSFQWDALLLEAGFLAIFLHPRSRIVIFLFRWLLFRLRFMSGLSKLVLQDPAWSGLTALNHYFEVQPLPTPLAWYAHQLPDWLLRFGTASTLVIELLVPLMMFLPRRWRFAAAWITIVWQVLIILTSNHNWFNFLTIALCLFLFDDRALRSVLPQRWVGLLQRQADALAEPRVMSRRMTMGLAGLIVFVSTVQIWELAFMRQATGLVGQVVDYTESFRVTSKYHVFPTMKTDRIELEIQGSVDGVHWKTYHFKYKPDRLDEMPAVVMPHHPRLDWMMWFVTLHPRFVPWFHEFLQSLLSNSPAVTGLLAHNPFAEKPPRYISVQAYRYRFADPQAFHQEGAWWQREYLGPFTPLPWVERRTP